MRCKNTGSFSAICWLVSVAMVVVWGVSMGCATFLQAQSYYEVLRGTQPKAWEDKICRGISGIAAYYEEENEDISKDGHWTKWWSLAIMTSYANLTDYYFLRDTHMQSATGLLVRNSKGETVVSNRDIMMCEYVSEQTWNKGGGSPDGNAWVDLEQDPALKAALVQLGDLQGFSFFGYLRITGYFEGEELIPLKVEYGEYVGSGFQGVKEFVTVYEATAWEGEETVTVYARNNRISLFAEDLPVRYQGKRYQNSVELLKAVGKAEDQESLVELIEFKSMTMQAPDANGTEETYTVLLAFAHYPLRAAAEKLTRVYLWTFMLMAVVAFAVFFIIYKNLFHPLSVLEAGFFGMVRERRSWAEPHRLAYQVERLDRTINERNHALRKKDNEIFKLNQSIDYVRSSEENRRQMVSAIAHELKTPLAIISGYTEGLQEQIAEEKREQYLQTILSEAQHMDELVMEMLELSRLEAGRITLARDEFDLSALVREIFDKLCKEAESKQLRLEFDFHFDTPVYADEGRMEQVIRNLASNAVHYSPEGGRIRVSTERMPGSIELRMYNDAKPFTEEEMSKVWEVFYRTDSARRGKGTGLGLAITKNLIQLHGGSCSVRNVGKGVEFSFRIPQKY